MFNKIMLPLDGSDQAEKALPYAISLAERLDSVLVLAQVLPSTEKSDPVKLAAAADYMQQAYNRAIARLLRLQMGAGAEAGQIQTRVIAGDAVSTLAELAQQEKVGLIVMTTPAHTELPHLLIGSVAQGLLKQTDLPVLLIQSDHLADNETTSPGNILDQTESEAAQFTQNPFLHLVVTLDGSSEAEAVLGLATQLAESLDAPIHLLRINQQPIEIQKVNTQAGNASKVKTNKQNSKLLGEIHRYMGTIQNRLLDQDIYCPEVVRSGSDVAAEIIHFSRNLGGPVLLIMATHAGNWGDQFKTNSISEEVIRDSHLPVLLLKVPSSIPLLVP